MSSGIEEVMAGYELGACRVVHPSYHVVDRLSYFTYLALDLRSCTHRLLAGPICIPNPIHQSPLKVRYQSTITTVSRVDVDMSQNRDTL